MSTLRYTADKNLRIWTIFDLWASPPIVTHVDFTTIGLSSKPSVYGAGGVKIKHEYTNEEDEVVVRKTFSYLDSSTSILIEWIDNEGEVGLSKLVTKPMSEIEVASLRKANRERTLMFLKLTLCNSFSTAEVENMFTKYKYSIELWVLNNTDEWKLALLTEPEFKNDGTTVNPIYTLLYSNIKDGIVLDLITSNIGVSTA